MSPSVVAWAASRFITDTDENTLAVILSEDVGIEHAKAVARIVRECGFSAEEIVCVNGYGPDGNPELYALASIGWPLDDTRRTLERWAAEAYVHDLHRRRRDDRPCAVCGGRQQTMRIVGDHMLCWDCARASDDGDVS